MATDPFSTYKFTGKELDEETGLYYYGARYYDPRTSVWASADPILAEYMDGKGQTGGIYNPQMLQFFTYVGNNPINAVDPDGEELVRLNTSSFKVLRENIFYENHPRAQRGIIVDSRFAGQAASYLSSWIDNDYEVRINNTFRTTDEQLNVKTRLEKSKGTSAHEGGGAMDISVRKKGTKVWLNPTATDIGHRLAKEAGMRSGGDFKDPPHADAGKPLGEFLGYKNRDEASKINQADWEQNKDYLNNNTEGSGVHFFIEKSKFENNYQGKDSYQ